MSFGLGYERRRISRNGAPSFDENGIWEVGRLVRNADRMPSSEMRTRIKRAVWMSSRSRFLGNLWCESGPGREEGVSGGRRAAKIVRQVTAKMASPIAILYVHGAWSSPARSVHTTNKTSDSVISHLHPLKRATDTLRSGRTPEAIR